MKTIDFTFDNVGGMSRLYLFDATQLVRVENNVSDGTVRPVLATGIHIYNIVVYGDDAFKFSEKMVLEDGGNAFEVSISGFIPRLDNIVAVDELEQGEWIAIHQDANGTILMSGTKEVPLRFVTEKSTGNMRNATSFVLQATEPSATMVVDGAALEL